MLPLIAHLISFLVHLWLGQSPAEGPDTEHLPSSQAPFPILYLVSCSGTVITTVRFSPDWYSPSLLGKASVEHAVHCCDWIVLAFAGMVFTLAPHVSVVSHHLQASANCGPMYAKLWRALGSEQPRWKTYLLCPGFRGFRSCLKYPFFQLGGSRLVFGYLKKGLQTPFKLNGDTKPAIDSLFPCGAELPLHVCIEYILLPSRVAAMNDLSKSANLFETYSVGERLRRICISQYPC